MGDRNGPEHAVKLRASQINQCGFCQHMHAEEARESDENQSRLDVLSAWRELDCFSFEERTALAWTEALTLIHSSTITEEMYNSVESTFGKEGLIELTRLLFFKLIAGTVFQ
ncbi:carboxymuconolactone decarboxylase family protein [Alteromonas macleodii]|uniref:carboxymuconolactone decarboxylase family protein n=1 Tax=Alteromonas macleodii TaxID=28108 RepID=UPI0031409593